MTPEERVLAVRGMGFTEREARFLVAVMLHAGVCLSRQYCAHAGLVRGEQTHDFFKALVAKRLATTYPTAHRGTFIYHVHGKRLYRAIGEAENRHRRVVTLARAIERLMLLDAVLCSPEYVWLATAREKIDHFERVTSLHADAMPQLVFGKGAARQVRYFPDKLPIGYMPGDHTHVLLYGLTGETPLPFRRFLHRHAELLRALRAWEIRLLVPPHLAEHVSHFELAAGEELEQPLAPTTAHDLRWYFEQRQRADAGQPVEDQARFDTLVRTFRRQRDWALYRSWKRDGDGAVYGATSPLLAAALASQDGRITRHTLTHHYLHLAPLVGSA